MIDKKVLSERSNLKQDKARENEEFKGEGSQERELKMHFEN